MSVYVIAQLQIGDSEVYNRYAAAFSRTLYGYAGRLLAADEAVDVIEGEWHYDKVVLLEFESRAEFDRWSNSSEYRLIAEDRRAAADGPIVVLNAVRPLVTGVGQKGRRSCS